MSWGNIFLRLTRLLLYWGLRGGLPVLYRAFGTRTHVNQAYEQRVGGSRLLERFFNGVFFGNYAHLTTITSCHLRVQRLTYGLRGNVQHFIFSTTIRTTLTLTVTRHIPRHRIVLVRRDLLNGMVLQRILVWGRHRRAPRTILQVYVVFLLLRQFCPQREARGRCSTILVCS